jgi:hypothetical protein
MYGRRWDQAEVDTLKMLVGLNHSSPAIAKQLHRHPQVVRQKAYDLGLRLKPQRKTPEARCKLDRETLAGLSAAAQRYGHTTIPGLLRELLVTIDRDDLYAAILDQPPTQRRTTVKQYHRPSAIPRPAFVAPAPQLFGSLAPTTITGRAWSIESQMSRLKS